MNKEHSQGSSGDQRNKSLLELLMFTTCYLFQGGYPSIEVSFTNLMMESSKSFVEFFAHQNVYHPLEGMVKEEFMPLVEDVGSEEKRRAHHEKFSSLTVYYHFCHANGH